MPVAEGAEHFFLATFHQDWDLDFPDEESAVRGYVERNSRDKCRDIVAELDRLLESGYSEKRLRKIITRDMGASVNPPKGHPRWRRWLQATRDHLVREIENLG